MPESNTHSINWTHAFGGRMEEAKPAKSRFTALAAPIAEHLANEIGKGALPFINMPYQAALEAELPRIMAQFKDLKNMLLLGIGGSALGARALQKAFYPQQDYPGHTGKKLWIADNINAAELTAWLDGMPAKDCVVVVISKSGGTIETMAQYFLVRAWLKKELGDNWVKHVLLVTDAEQGPLRQEAREKGLPALPVPNNLGGRYSVLSAVGLVPALFCGMDWQALLSGANKIFAPLLQAGKLEKNLRAHPAWSLSLWARELMEHSYSQLIFFSYIPSWSFLGAWFAQLWAESLGKNGKGSMPLPAVGVTDQHSLQQMFLDGPKDKGCLFMTCPTLPAGPKFSADLPTQWDYLKGKQFGELLQAEGLGTRMALTTTGTPLAELRMANSTEEAAGSLIALLGLTTLITGLLLDINPLDQPAVELGKRLANARLGAQGYAEELSRLEAFLKQPEIVQGF